MPILILAIVIAFSAIFWWLGVPALRKRRRIMLSLTAVPPQWIRWLWVDVPLYRRLPEPLRARLNGLIHIFATQKSFVGCNGLVLTERMKVVIAANACLLVLNRPGVPAEHLYDELMSILVYPSAFIVPETVRLENGLVSEGHRVLSGQAWDSRRIILSWDDIQHAPGAGHNVVLHEFAHYLDMEDETMDGAPGLGTRAAHQQWARVFWHEYDQLRANLGAGLPTLINPYAATAPAEFFAVVTEVFFGQPRELETLHPQLYEQLRSYYRLDPAQWGADPTPALAPAIA
jgi:Mlc titration factor MtfA (ptsG expression regulator)